jgi:hypothetical protein
LVHYLQYRLKKSKQQKKVISTVPENQRPTVAVRQNEMDLISLPPPARNRCPHDTGAAALSRNDAFVAETVSRPGLVWLWPFLSRSSEKSIGENQCVVCVYRSEVLLAGHLTAPFTRVADQVIVPLRPLLVSDKESKMHRTAAQQAVSQLLAH